MALASCVRCKQLFTKVKSAVCPKCQPEEEADLEKVRQELEERPNQSAEEVVEKTGVTRDCVMRLLEDGRIVNTMMMDAVKCGRCGAPAISPSKRLCQACLDKLNKEVLQAQSKIHLGPKKKFDGTDQPQSVHVTINSKRRI